MVQVLLRKVPVLTHLCSNCHSLLAYQYNDIYENHFIYCPLCKSKEEILFDVTYDGVVKDGK